MSAPTPEEIEELLSQSVERLSELLKILYPDPDPDDTADNPPLIDPNILTLDSFKLRYRLTGLGALAVTAIEQAQRITRDICNFEDIGLCEFHIGLIYLHSQDYRGAAQQFREAWQQWSFANKTAAIRLAFLAEGLALHHAYSYEAALSSYGKAEQMKYRIHLEPSPNNRDAFLKQFHDYLVALQQAARTTLENQTTPEEESDESDDESETAVGSEIDDENETADESEAASESETAVPDHQIIVPPPAFPPQPPPDESTTPIPAHINTNDEYIWYRVHIRRQDNLFTDIEEHGWLLVNTQTSDHDFAQGDLIVIASDKQEASISLEPHLPDSQVFHRIYLARTEFAGRFTREDGRVQLSSEIKQIPVSSDDILGYVIGLWLEAKESEILSRQLQT